MRIDITKERERLTALEGHTPGPWGYSKCLCGHHSCNQYTISTQGGVGFDVKDAALIAAAPDLHAHLTAALDEIARLTAEVERLSKGSICEVAATNPSVMEYMRHWEERAEIAETERDALVAAAYEVGQLRMRELCADMVEREGHGLHVAIRYAPLTPSRFAQAALDNMLAEARLEGWRAGRDAATEKLTSLAAILRESEIPYHQSQASALLERVGAIQALPEPKEASHD